MMTVFLSYRLYSFITLSGVLLDGTWAANGDTIKINGNTAEFYRDGAAESAVICILSAEDRLIEEGKIIYHIEACFPHRIERIDIEYTNCSGSVLIELVNGSESEVFLFE